MLALSPLFYALVHLDAAWRVVIAVLALAPLGLALGLPMPSGIRLLAQRAPEAEINRGRLIAEYRQLRSIESPSDPQTARLAELRTQLDELKKASPHSESLSFAAYEATTGNRTWESLRQPDTGWAQSSLPGYKDLGLRLGDRRDPQGVLPL